jgi:hypothetical protein
MRDEGHWLWRLDPTQWVAAARHELEQGHAAIASRRTAVTHARRAAGMALNGVLVAMAARGWPRERCESVWGRSYLDHLRVLAEADASSAEPLEAALGDSAKALLAIPVQGATGLVSLSRSRDEAAQRALALAATIVDAAQRSLPTA